MADFGTTTTPTTLHSFPRLPFEIREQIWRYAIRPGEKRGIHDFRFYDNKKLRENDSLITLPHKKREDDSSYAGTIPGLNDDETNRSAYMWDAGLWTACSESREVIRAAFNMAEGAQKSRLIQLLGLWHQGIFRGTRQHVARDFVGMATSIRAPPLRQDGWTEEWSLAFRPYFDAIRLNYEDFRTLRESIQNIKFWSIMDDIGFKLVSSDFFGERVPRHFVFEFDASWNQDLPEHFWSTPFHGPRALFSALLSTIGWSVQRLRWWGDTDDVYDWHIWLVDRSGYHTEVPSDMEWKQIPEIRFFDYNEEFEAVSTTSGRDDPRTAAHFIRQLKKYEEYLSQLGMRCANYHRCCNDDPEFQFKDHIGVLVPTKRE